MAMNSEHERLRRLILAWEDLDEVERAAAEAHLVDCEACRALRAHFERRERDVGPRGALPETTPALDPAERQRARASRHALLERLGVGESASPLPGAARPRSAWIPRLPRWSWMAPAAAAAVFAFLWLARTGPQGDAVLEEFAAVRTSVLRGGDSLAAPLDSAWRTGETFELRVRLARPGWPAVVHVGPDGLVTLLRPEEADTSSMDVGVQRLGPVDAGESWVLEDPPGAEDLFVALRPRGPVDREALLQALRAAERSGTRASRLEAVRRALMRHVGPVRRLTLQHR